MNETPQNVQSQGEEPVVVDAQTATDTKPENFREGFQQEYSDTVDKVEGFKGDLEKQELQDFSKEAEKDIAYLEEQRDQICSKEKGENWKDDPEISKLLTTEPTAPGEEAEEK